MKFNQAATASVLFALMSPPVNADFDIWETNMYWWTCAGGDCTSDNTNWITVTQPHRPFDEVVCAGRTTQPPYCDRDWRFSNGCARIVNCAAWGEPWRLRDQEWFGDLIDCNGENIGYCFAWNTGHSANTCVWPWAFFHDSVLACRTGRYWGDQAVNSNFKKRAEIEAQEVFGLPVKEFCEAKLKGVPKMEMPASIKETLPH